MQQLEDLQQLLLDLVSTERSVDSELLARMEDVDWDAMKAMLCMHRLGPLLHWRLTHERKDVAVPVALRSEAASAFKKSALHALACQREIIRVQTILEDGGIPSIALKGAYLANFAYPHPALRPLRDIDVLVPTNKGIAAFRTLLDAGYRQLTPFYGGDAEACLASAKHLPPLRSSESRLDIELHVRLPGFADAMNTEVGAPSHWQRAVFRPIGDRAVRYQSLTDLLYLMITHAVYDHRLDNGPLVLTDIYYLTETGNIDWSEFWHLAEVADTYRGCVLMLRLTERYFGKLSVIYPETPLHDPDELDMVLDACPGLLLSSAHVSSVMLLAGGLAGKSWGKKLAALWDGVVSPKHRSGGNSPWARCRDFVRRAWQLVVKYLPGLWGNRGSAAAADGIRKLAQLNRWVDP